MTIMLTFFSLSLFPKKTKKKDKNPHAFFWILRLFGYTSVLYMRAYGGMEITMVEEFSVRYPWAVFSAFPVNGAAGCNKVAVFFFCCYFWCKSAEGRCRKLWASKTRTRPLAAVLSRADKGGSSSDVLPGSRVLQTHSAALGGGGGGRYHLNSHHQACVSARRYRDNRVSPVPSPWS